MLRSSATPICFESLESRRQLAADFTASIVTPAANATLTVGVETTAYVTVTNAGTAMDRDTRVAVNLYASADDTFNPETDLLLGSRTISRLSSGESETEDIEFTLASNLASSTPYRLFARVDPANQFAESNEENNTSSPVSVTFSAGSGGGGGGGGGGGSGVDLTVTLNTPTATLVSGREGKLFVNATNGGNTSSTGAVVEIFVQAGDSPDPGADTLLASRSFNSLSAGETEFEDVSFVVPSGIAAGTHRLYAVIDRAGSISETNEDNNRSESVEATFSTTSGGGGGGGGGGGSGTVDLSVAVTAPTSALIPNVEQKVFVSVFNNGTASATTRTTVELYIMRGSSPDPATDTLLGSRSVSRVSAGERELEDIEFRLPSGVTAGDYQIYAVIDRAGTVTESNEDNNVSATVAATVGEARRDLGGQIGRTSVPSSVVQGEKAPSASVSLTVSNLGNQDFERSSSANVRAYLRPVGVDDSSQDVAVSDSKRESLSSLTSGKSRSSSLKLKLPSNLSAGEYRLIVKIDDSGAHSESDESNNTLNTGRTIQIATPTVDLAFSGSTYIAPSRVGQAARASVSVTNLGNSGFKNTATIQFFYVDSGNVETAASGVTSKRIDLKAGRIQKFDKLLLSAAPTTPGTYTLIARVTGTGDVNSANNTITVRTFTV